MVLGSGKAMFMQPIFIHDKTTYVVPDTATDYNGDKYKVTAIDEEAFSNVKEYITTLKIGKNVKDIGEKAFFKCTKLKSIIIKTKKLSMSSVGKNAFGKLNKKCVAKVPKAKFKEYKKILKKKGFKIVGQKVKKS